MIVDTPGFQNPEQGGAARGASFEELCHNYAQDRLQRLFHERTFVQELERYKEVALDLGAACSLPPSLTLWPRPLREGICGGGDEPPSPLAAPSQLLRSCNFCPPVLSGLGLFSCPSYILT